MPSIREITPLRVADAVKAQLKVGGRVLEISCGAGKVLLLLKDAGYDVRGTNFTAHPDARADLPIDDGVDLIAGLPYDDHSFDAVLLCDVIEHISDHHRAVSEASRVLRPGGIMIIVTPNIMKLSSRLHFLFTGFFKIKRAFIGFDVAPQDAFAFHNHPPHLPVLLYQLHAHGVDAVKLNAIGFKLRSLVMYALLLPLIVPLTLLKVHVEEKNLRGTPAAGKLFRTLTSFNALTGEVWMLVGRKRVVAQQIESKTKLPEWAGRIEAESHSRAGGNPEAAPHASGFPHARE